MASFGGIVVADPSLAAHFTQAELRSLKSQVISLSLSLSLMNVAQLVLFTVIIVSL